MRAAELGYWEADLLLNLRSVDVSCPIKGGTTALSIAISRGNDLIVKRLFVLSNIDINGRSPTSQFPLEVALEYQQYYIFQLLLSDPRIMINNKNKLGQTPLYHAVEYGDHVAYQPMFDDLGSWSILFPA